MGIFSKVALGWLVRRVPDWGGWIGAFVLSIAQLYNSLPESAKDAVQQTIAGRWQEITLGSLLPLLALVFSQVLSWRATVKPQVVTRHGDKVSLGKLPASVEESADTAARAQPHRTLLERLTGRRR